MLPFILGLMALLLGFFALRAFTQANPGKLALTITRLGGVLVLGGAAWLVSRGALPTALPVALMGLWLLSGPGSGNTRLGSDRGATSTVTTDHLEMELDHGSGAMRGRVLKGFFEGRSLDDLKPVELAHLWQDCRFTDPESAQLVEAYLDRVHPSWREDMARAEEQAPKGPDGRMTREEALEILGLEGRPDADTVRRAHRELMLKLHPDRGGSTYLAAKVNEAKDVLLDDEG